MKNRLIAIILAAIVVAVLIVLIFLKPNTEDEKLQLYANVVRGDFDVRIETSGEVEAKKSVRVYGAMQLRRARIYQIKIADLVPEGTLVKKGDVVAQLDKSEVAEKIKSQELELESKMLDLNQAKIDTALTLQQARNELENLQSGMIEKKLEVEKSVYEPPVIQKQAQAAFEKAERNYRQAQKDYKLKLQKAKAKIRSANIRIAQVQQYKNVLDTVLQQLTILAPEDGMVMHIKDWRGNKIGKNEMISTWEPVVAELPDLSVLISKTYINEVDIRKIKEDQVVDVTFDAFPDKKMSGKVIEVANVGESSQNSKVKVFQVDIEINGTDKDVKPGMTTGNSIIANELSDVLYLPIETVFSEGDSIHYVYLTKKIKVQKQQVLIGDRNDQDVVIRKGLQENDKVLFIPPENSEDMPITLLENSISDNIASSEVSDQLN